MKKTFKLPKSYHKPNTAKSTIKNTALGATIMWFAKRRTEFFCSALFCTFILNTALKNNIFNRKRCFLYSVNCKVECQTKWSLVKFQWRALPSNRDQCQILWSKIKKKSIWYFLREFWNPLLFTKYLEISSSLEVTFISSIYLPWLLSWENVEFASLGVSRGRQDQFLSNLIQLLWGGGEVTWPSKVPSKLNCSMVPWFNLPSRYPSQKQQVKGCWERQTCSRFFGGCFYC